MKEWRETQRCSYCKRPADIELYCCEEHGSSWPLCGATECVAKLMGHGFEQVFPEDAAALREFLAARTQGNSTA